MDLWKARKRYRRITPHLRKTQGSLVRVETESRLLATLLQGERLESELATLHFARRGTGARMRRALEWLEKAVLLADRQPLVRACDVATLQRYESELERLAAEEARRAVSVIQRDLEQLERKWEEVRERLKRCGREAAELAEALAALAG